MMMLGSVKEDLKSPEETQFSGDISGKLSSFLTDSDDEREVSHEVLVVEEEKLEEIMQELYKEITLTTSTAYNPLPSSSSSSSLTFFPVSDIKISESCGASMSDSSSTVMAGIEFVGPTGKLSDVKGVLTESGNGGTPGMGVDDQSNNNFNNNDDVLVTGGGERCDEGEDQWVARVVLGLGGPVEVEEWTSTFLSC